MVGCDKIASIEAILRGSALTGIPNLKVRKGVSVNLKWKSRSFDAPARSSARTGPTQKDSPGDRYPRRHRGCQSESVAGCLGFPGSVTTDTEIVHYQELRCAASD